MRSILLALALFVAGPALAEVPTQLPRTADPVAYDLTLTPDLAKLTFKGKVAVTYEAKAAGDRVVLNAADLDIASAAIDGAPAKVTLDAAAQTATFVAARPLSAGRHVLTVDYAGKIQDRPSGLFHVDYEGGRMLATQFEPADARRLLPLFDEPAKKAVFTVSAVVPQTLTAVSNMPETSSQPVAGGLKHVRFAPSPKMSSYLLFFGLGDFERISSDVDGTKVSVLMRRGDAEKGRFALNAAAELVRYYNDYFGVKYPLPKLDLVGAPGEAAGAMENWGAILFTQTYLTVDPKLSTAADRQTVYMVVAHEIAHMWFGDIVTMAWWDDLWLNEGFASWMASKATDHFHPEWKYLLTALADKDQALRLDARSATHPVVQPVETVAQAEQAFDDITYMKGEAVIRMLEGYAGADAWREGVRAHIRDHAYGNATSADLWRAIDKAAGKPVSAIAHDFTFQPGVPLISVSGGTAATLAQGRFGADEASKTPQTWRTPVRLRRLAGGAVQELVVSGDRPQPSPLPGPVVANAGQTGYFRTLYDEAAFAPIAARLGALPAADQFGLLNDGYALGMAGYGPISNYLRLVGALPVEADPLVWREQARVVAGIDDYYDAGPRRDAYRAWATGVLHKALDRVGLDARAGEPDNDAVARERLLEALSQLGDRAVIAEARRRYEAVGGELGRLSSAVERRWVQATVARAATPAEFDALLALARRTSDPLERQRIWTDLAAVNDPALAQRMLELAITDQPPSNTGSRLVQAVAAGHPDLAWRFSLANLPQITRSTDALTRSSFAPNIAGYSHDPKRAEELEAYARQNIPEDAWGEVRVALSRIRTAAEIREKRLPGVDAWLTGRRRP
ncbi:M1 family metallopeptidase [Phenylobacterium sp. VNQ135]|uniref:M1 family metallopeptidase n=1 Tax=Phenylobacterium sp. VNQ135 TaxID=3400922 RepID=UPI003C03E2A8